MEVVYPYFRLICKKDRMVISISDTDPSRFLHHYTANTDNTDVWPISERHPHLLDENIKWIKRWT